MRGERYGPGGVRALGGGSAIGVHGEGPTQGCGDQGTRGAHLEHGDHVRDAGRIPIGNVRVEILQAFEEVAHIGDGRHAPVSDGAVNRSGGSR
eukprot:scaffold6827_cov55-Phaeocystis_antarctica.AAC.6